MANGHGESKEHGSGIGFGTGLFAGAVIGAGVGLLFAPRAGAQLRRDIAATAANAGKAVTKQYRRSSQAVGETIDELASRGRSAYRQTRKVASHARGGITRTMDEAWRGGEHIASAARDAAKEMVADLRSRA